MQKLINKQQNNQKSILQELEHLQDQEEQEQMYEK